jgi:hypothetical protein
MDQILGYGSLNVNANMHLHTTMSITAAAFEGWPAFPGRHDRVFTRAWHIAIRLEPGLKDVVRQARELGLANRLVLERFNELLEQEK